MANSDIHSTSFLGATAHLTNKTIIKITEKNYEPIWTKQWPLMKEKLQATKELINTQLKWKHTEESCSFWNSPIFVIKRKHNKWCHLTEFRKVKSFMKPMGALQPEIPTPITIPQNWHIIVTDSQDCFLNIPLHPLDRERFTFSLPYPNHIGPQKRFQ